MNRTKNTLIIWATLLIFIGLFLGVKIQAKGVQELGLGVVENFHLSDDRKFIVFNTSLGQLFVADVLSQKILHQKQAGKITHFEFLSDQIIVYTTEQQQLVYWDYGQNQIFAYQLMFTPDNILAISNDRVAVYQDKIVQILHAQQGTWLLEAELSFPEKKLVDATSNHVESYWLGKIAIYKLDLEKQTFVREIVNSQIIVSDPTITSNESAIYLDGAKLYVSGQVYSKNNGLWQKYCEISSDSPVGFNKDAGENFWVNDLSIYNSECQETQRNPFIFNTYRWIPNIGKNIAIGASGQFILLDEKGSGAGFLEQLGFGAYTEAIYCTNSGVFLAEYNSGDRYVGNQFSTIEHLKILDENVPETEYGFLNYVEKRLVDYPNGNWNGTAFLAYDLSNGQAFTIVAAWTNTGIERLGKTEVYPGWVENVGSGNLGKQYALGGFIWKKSAHDEQFEILEISPQQVVQRDFIAKEDFVNVYQTTLHDYLAILKYDDFRLSILIDDKQVQQIEIPLTGIIPEQFFILSDSTDEQLHFLLLDKENQKLVSFGVKPSTGVVDVDKTFAIDAEYIADSYQPNQIWVLTTDGEIQTLDLRLEKVISTIARNQKDGMICSTPNGTYLYHAQYDGVVTRWKLK